MGFCDKKSVITYRATHNDAIGALAVVRSGMVLSGSRDKMIALNNMDTGECVLRWYGHEKEITKLSYWNAIGNHYILSGSRDSQIRLWRFNHANTIRTFNGHQMSITGLAVIDDYRFVSGARDTTLRSWDIETGKCIRFAQHPRNLGTHLSYSGTNNLIIQSSEDKRLKIWDSQRLELIYEFPQKNHILTHCDLLPDGNYCVTSCNGFNGDGCVISLWDLRMRKHLLEYRGHEESVNCAIYVPQQIIWKRVLVSVSADQTIKLWNLDTAECLWSQTVATGSDLLSCVAFPDGNIVVSGLNATLCHLKMLNRTGRPVLQCISVQSRSQYSVDF